jgi:hypothetical protein
MRSAAAHDISTRNVCGEEELLALLEVSEEFGGAQHLERGAQPAKAILPGASAPDRFWDRRRHRGDDRASVREDVELDGER